MIVAGVLIETTPGAAPQLATRLLGSPGIELQGGDGVRRIAAVVTGADGSALEALSERLLQEHPEILGIYPTFIGDDTAGVEPGDGGAP
jgi:hypothetical protein